MNRVDLCVCVHVARLAATYLFPAELCVSSCDGMVYVVHMRPVSLSFSHAMRAA